MALDRKGDTSNRIPINFVDSENETSKDVAPENSNMSNLSPEHLTNDMDSQNEAVTPSDEGFEEVDLSCVFLSQADGSPADVSPQAGGTEVAELVATRAELKRLEGEVKELRDSLARRQADFENYRKRMERGRSE